MGLSFIILWVSPPSPPQQSSTGGAVVTLFAVDAPQDKEPSSSLSCHESKQIKAVQPFIVKCSYSCDKLSDFNKHYECCWMCLCI